MYSRIGLFVLLASGCLCSVSALAEESLNPLVGAWKLLLSKRERAMGPLPHSMGRRRPDSLSTTTPDNSGHCPVRNGLW